MPRDLLNNGLKIDAYNFEPGRSITKKYVIVSKLGSGWQGEVYKIREKNTNIERAAKIFYPHRNVKNIVSDAYAKKLHALNDCPMIIQYHSQESIIFRRTPITVLISEYVEGELLSDYLARMRGKRLSIFQGIHLLHALLVGVESIHHHREYHGDLHPENIIVKRLGLTYELKLLDLFQWGQSRRENMKDDICDLIRIFYDAIGGSKHYSKHPQEIKAICCGLKKSIILRKFKTVKTLRLYIEQQNWSSLR